MWFKCLSELKLEVEFRECVKLSVCGYVLTAILSKKQSDYCSRSLKKAKYLRFFGEIFHFQSILQNNPFFLLKSCLKRGLIPYRIFGQGCHASAKYPKGSVLLTRNQNFGGLRCKLVGDRQNFKKRNRFDYNESALLHLDEVASCSCDGKNRCVTFGIVGLGGVF